MNKYEIIVDDEQVRKILDWVNQNKKEYLVEFLENHRCENALQVDSLWVAEWVLENCVPEWRSEYGARTKSTNYWIVKSVRRLYHRYMYGLGRRGTKLLCIVPILDEQRAYNVNVRIWSRHGGYAALTVHFRFSWRQIARSSGKIVVKER